MRGSAVFGVACVVLCVAVFVGLTSRSQSVVIAVSVVAVSVLAGLSCRYAVSVVRSRSWWRAVRSARWVAVSREQAGRTIVVVQRVAVFRGRREVLMEQVVEELPVGVSGEEWEARYLEALGRAENRAFVRNGDGSRYDVV